MAELFSALGDTNVLKAMFFLQKHEKAFFSVSAFMEGLPFDRETADAVIAKLLALKILKEASLMEGKNAQPTPALVKSFVTKQTKNVTIGAGCDHGGVVTSPWRLVTFPGQRCDLWSHGINLRVSGQPKKVLEKSGTFFFFVFSPGAFKSSPQERFFMM